MDNEVIDPYGAGATSVVKPAATAATNSTPYGYGQTQADAVVAWIRKVHDALVQKGIIEE